MTYLVFVAGSSEVQTPLREGGYGLAMLNGDVEDVESLTRGDILDYFGGKGYDTTTHRMELEAVKNAVRFVKEGDTVVVATNNPPIVIALTRDYSRGYDYVNGDIIEDVFTIADVKGVNISAIQVDSDNTILSFVKQVAKDFKNRKCMKYIAYTDGCSRPHFEPHNGGWAYIVLKDRNFQDIVHKGLGYKTQTTNNEMEITAIVELMKWLPENSYVEICADSLIAINACSRGIISKDNLRELAVEYERLRLRKGISVAFMHVKGHSEDLWNDRVDILTNYARNTADLIYGVDFGSKKEKLLLQHE